MKGTLSGLAAFGEGEDGSSFDWTQLPAVLRDIYLSYNLAEAQQKLIELNLERAARGQAPLNIDLASLRPGVQIGMSNDVKWLIGALGVGTIAAIALAARRRR